MINGIASKRHVEIVSPGAFELGGLWIGPMSWGIQGGFFKAPARNLKCHRLCMPHFLLYSDRSMVCVFLSAVLIGLVPVRHVGWVPSMAIRIECKGLATYTKMKAMCLVLHTDRASGNMVAL